MFKLNKYKTFKILNLLNNLKDISCSYSLHLIRRFCTCIWSIFFHLIKIRNMKSKWKCVVICGIRSQSVILGLHSVDRSIVRSALVKNYTDSRGSSGISNTRRDKLGCEAAHISNRSTAHFLLFSRKLVFIVPSAEYLFD